MKQPREGIAGVDRTGDPLVSLDDALLPVRDALFGAGWNLLKATHVGNPAPVVAKMCARIGKPQPGDYVGVGDTAYRRNPTDEDRVHRCGYLVESRREWMHTDTQWTTVQPGEDESPERQWGPDSRPSDDAIYIQYGPAPEDVVRWTNATAFMIPLAVRGPWNE